MKKYRKTKLPVLDEIDKNIIKELQVDALQSYVSLKEKIGTSEGTVRNRVKKLLEQEMISIKAVLNPVKVGFDFSCVIGMEIAINKLREAGKILMETPNVYFLVGCTGDFDLLAILFFRNTAEFDSFMGHTIAKLPGLRRSRTFVNMTPMKAPWGNNLDVKKLFEF